ncbi:hypothetical protein ABG067_009600, partial [Albugo candida]
MRRKGPRLYMFRPVEDLHYLVNKNTSKNRSAVRGMDSQGMFDMTGAGSQSNTDITVEMEEFVIN